jgi:hypothetical protein
MEKLLDPRAVLEKVEEGKKSSLQWVTNYYHNEAALEDWILTGRFFHERIGSNTFFFRPDSDFQHISYVSPSYEELARGLMALAERPEILVADVIAKEPGGGMPLKTFQNSGFHLYCTLMRMSKPSGADERNTAFDGDVRIAAREDAPGIYKILAGNFDRFAEQIPIIPEIERDIRMGRYLVCEQNGRLIGLAHFERTGLTSHWRRWYVDPEFRDLRIGSKLRNSYFSLTKEAARHIFWVLTTNANHISIQRKWGFREDGLIDMVFINKGHIRYGS